MKLTHPESDLAIEVDDRNADAYLSQGWREATSEAPAGNASLEAWQAFALRQGMTEDDIEDLTRDDLRAALS